jgi:mRNA-degrading endonuclease toxin of MazEF toxin-antitoxin module
MKRGTVRNIQTVSKQQIEGLLTTLRRERMDEVELALAFALGMTMH